MYHPVEDSVKAGITTSRKTNEPLTTCNSKFEDEAVSVSTKSNILRSIEWLFFDAPESMVRTK